MESVSRSMPEVGRRAGEVAPAQVVGERYGGYFQMPLHYPRYTRSEYETMPEWKLDCILAQYGLPAMGDVEQKRKFAMGAFLWSSF